MIEVDGHQWPLLLVRFEGQVTDAEFQHYLDSVSRHLDRGEPHVTLLIAAPNVPMTRSLHVRLQTQWIRQEHARMQRYSRGIGFVMPTVVTHGVVRAILTVAPLPSTTAVFRSEPAALAWARQLLAP